MPGCRRLLSAARHLAQRIGTVNAMACHAQATSPVLALHSTCAAPVHRGVEPLPRPWRAARRAFSVALQPGGAAELRAHRNGTQRPAVLTFKFADGGEALVGAAEASAQDTAEASAVDSVDATLAEVWVVETREQAELAVQALRAYKPRNQGAAYHAIDTEVAGINLTEETPVGHGRIVCFSVYCGPDADFTGDGTKKCLWVDVLKGGQPVLDAFKSYLEDASILKVWHNYSFDKHIFENVGINPAGFACDTMHMARLWDSSRALKGYSLEALTSDDEVMMDAGDGFDANRSKSAGLKELFGRPNIKKDGTEGKLLVLPDIQELQEDPSQREKWITYSARDAEATWFLRESLEIKLRNMRAESPRQYIECITGDASEFKMCQTMWEFYNKYWRPFGDLLVTMERHGMQVDKGQLEKAQVLAEQHRSENENKFREWVLRYCPDAKHMNVGSGTQIRQLLFAGFTPTSKARKPARPRKKTEANGEVAEPAAPPAGSEPLVPYEKEFKYVTPEWEAWDRGGREGKAPKKAGSFVLRGIVKNPIEVTDSILTETKLPSTSVKTLRIMAGKPNAAADMLKRWEAAEAANDAAELAKLHVEASNVCRILYNAFGGGKAGIEAAGAIDALCEAAAVETLLTNFILPLQQDALRGPEQRVHCSLNINTETGRLSARKPNLQNQPALEKDRYYIRRAFACQPDNSLIVADYGQLELRLLAHMANCQSMLTAFKAGGDFHSRTAMGMYPYIREAVDAGQCLLEFDGPEDKAPVPLLKNKFAVERRKAKILNFSIAYGKTKHGLSRDWGVTLEEAEKTVQAWYADRPEVKAWQDEQHQHAGQHGVVYTLLGRQRRLPDAVSSGEATGAAKQHALRAAINTPIQGGAADIAMLAMLELNKSELLKQLGWRLLMQVHDEVILEGPMSNADAALAEVRRAMQNPFNGKNLLRVDLDVSAHHAKSWYDAK